MTQAQAAVVRQPGGDFTIETIDVEAPRAGEVRVRIAGVGLCHTDLIFRDQFAPFALPGVLGHEGAGVIEAIGEGVGGLAVGDEVVIEAVHPDCRREVVTVGSLPVDPPIHVLLAAGCVNSYSGLPAIYRYRWFWPILRMADPGAQIVTSERRMNFTLSVDLLYQPGLVLDAWSVGRGSAYSVTEAMSGPDGASLPSLDRVSMADILAASRRSGIPSRTPGAWPP